MSKQELFDKFVELMGRFADIKEVAALRDGFIFSTPFTIAGSLFLLIANVPIPGYTDFMASIFGANWSAPLMQVSGATFDVLAIIIVLGMTYKYVEAEGCDALSASVLAVSALFIVIKSSVLSPGGEEVTGVIPKLWAGSNGVIAAIIVSIIVSKIFCYCEKNKITIKMPPQVPGGGTKSFCSTYSGRYNFYRVCNYLYCMQSDHKHDFP